MKTTIMALCVLLVLNTGMVARVEATNDEAELRELGRELVRLARSGVRGDLESKLLRLRIPGYRKWFAQVFGPVVGARLVREYEPMYHEFGQLFGEEIAKVVEEGKTVVNTRRFERPIDMGATGLQNAAMQVMKRPVTLYTLEFVESGKTRGHTFWSFVRAEGEFRFAGKMRAVRLESPRGDMIADVIDNVPMRDVEQLLQAKGMLSEGAVRYMQDRGLLAPDR
jgi:hypothetical protein